jgi:hypothetical protein
MMNRTRADEIPAAKYGPVVAALFGLLFVLSATASAQTFSILYQFKSGPGGINPEGGVVLDAGAISTAPLRTMGLSHPEPSSDSAHRASIKFFTASRELAGTAPFPSTVRS